VRKEKIIGTEAKNMKREAADFFSGLPLTV
jgi:hypothetical protein